MAETHGADVVTMTETADARRRRRTRDRRAAAPTPVASRRPRVGVLDQVRERGFITTGEIFAAFPDLEPDTDELREL